MKLLKVLDLGVWGLIISILTIIPIFRISDV